ncbi:hypothetical protein BJX64DRAFT_73037 [Aspergillus heterothallicus]
MGTDESVSLTEVAKIAVYELKTLSRQRGLFPSLQPHRVVAAHTESYRCFHSASLLWFGELNALLAAPCLLRKDKSSCTSESSVRSPLEPELGIYIGEDTLSCCSMFGCIVGRSCFLWHVLRSSDVLPTMYMPARPRLRATHSLLGPPKKTAF